MTKQETFKRRVRTRMEKTGERYAAARRSLLEQSANGRKRTWASEPEMNDEAVRTATGRGWDEWCDLIDAWTGDKRDHGAIAAYVHDAHGIDGWWSQTVTVGYERITGLRLPYQRPDGTFSAGKTRTVTVDADVLRAMLFDDSDRADLFPDIATELRSKPTSKVIRLAVGPGTAQIAMDPRDDGRTTISIAHEKLPSPDHVEEWKHFWAEWLEAIDEV